MKNLFYFTALTLLIGFANTLNGQSLITHDFDDGQLDPFYIAKADQEARVYIVDKSVETHWDQDLYNGTNSGRKAQFMPINELVFKQELWMGMNIKIHSDYMKDNTNTEAGLMQIWGFNGSTANHMCMLKFDGRNGGALCWQHRYNSVADKTHHLVYPNFPRNQFMKVVIRIKLSNYNEGIVQIWVDDVLKLDVSNQTIGWGDMNDDGMYNDTYASAASFGQYNSRESGGYDQTYDSENHYYDGHMDGETRTVTYDDVSLWNGADGYSIVDPDGGTSPEECGDFDAFSTIEAEYYCDQSGINTEACSEGGENVGWINDGDWLKFDDVDFGNGAASFDARVASSSSTGTIQLRLGSTSGTLIGSVDVSGTSGWQDWTTVSTDISGASGTQDLYLVFSDGGLNINWFEFTASASSGGFDAFSRIEAEDYTSQTGIQTEACSEGTDNVGWINDGDWIKFEDVDFGSGAGSVDVRAASKSTGGTIEFRLGSTTGTLVGTAAVSSTGGWQNWATESANISGASGTQDLYLVFDGGININWFEFTEGVTCATFSTIEAEDFNSMSGVVDEGANIGYIDNGDWCKYSNIDLSCAASIEVSASSKSNSGSIEVRLGSSTGTLIGTVAISATGNWNTWETSSANLSSVSGTNDVFLVFTGGSGSLFNVDWFEFSTNTKSAKLSPAILNNAENTIMVYPNPTSDILNIENGVGASVGIYNTLGRLVYNTNVLNNKQTIDLSEFSTGIYFLRMNNKGNVTTRKVLKQ